MTASQTLQRPGAPPAPGQAGARVPAVRPRRSRRPVALIAASLVVACVLALPLVFLLIEARGVGTATVVHLIFRRLTADLLWNTIRLTVVVTALCAVIGTAAAWTVERTNVPGRKIWAVLVVVPLAIPDFVVSFGWASLWTWIHGFRQPARHGPGPGGGGAQPGLQPGADLRPDHPRPGPGSHPGRLPAGRDG